VCIYLDFLEDVQRVPLFLEICTCCFPLSRNVSFLGPISSVHEMNIEKPPGKVFKVMKV